MTTYYSVKYDNEASGPFVAEGANLTWTGGVGFIVTVIDDGVTGKLKIALVSGVKPTNNLVLTQGSVTADANGDAREMLYPAYFREDLQVPSTGIMVWTGPALGTTHSFFFDGQSNNVVASEILTFSSGETCEVITVESDAGVSGELSVRFISDIDQGLPADDITFTGDISGDGTVNGAIHDRAYMPLHLHRLLSDLNDDEDIFGDDDLSRVDPVPSGKDTAEIVNLLSNMVINDTIAQHMCGGSISQDGGDTLYSGLDVQVTSNTADTRPVLIQNDAIVTDYWKNAFMPDSIAGNVRILRKTREDGVDIDGKRIRGGVLEFKDSYFFGGTTLGTASTALALFASPDGNNTTDAATVAGAPYNTIVVTEGYQTLDFNNGNGSTPFGLSIDYGSASALQAYERYKYIQRRGTSETLFNRNAQLFTGINFNFAYANETGGPLVEDEIIAWGTEITYSGQTANLTLGEVVTFAPSGAKGRLIYMDDNGATGTLLFMMESGIDPTTSDAMTGVTSSGDGDVDTVVLNTNAGTALLCALYDAGVTGNLYTQKLTGLVPINTQTIFGSTSNASCDLSSVAITRTINNQFIGVFTGTNFQTNFGLANDPTDAIVNDKFRNLLDVVQEPPNNQQGVVDGLEIGDVVTVYPWDGASYDLNGYAEPTYNEMALAAALVSGVTTIVDVGAGNIPKNTPVSGHLRVERDSDNNLELIEYSSHDGDDEFTLVGTSPINAAISNNLMRALIDDEVPSGSSLSYTAVKDGAISTQVAITVKNGGALNGPIKPYPTTATFGNGGFSVTASRISDA